MFMRLLFDTSLAINPKGGIERYVHNLVKSMCRQNDIYLTISTKLKKTVFSKVRMTPIPQFKPARIFGLINSYFIKKELKKNKIDIVHAFNYSINETVRKQSKETPIVSTVYDLTPEILNEIPVHTPYDAKKALFDSSTRIISISHSTKKDLIRYYKVDADKIDVVHLATDFPEITNLSSIASKKFIHIGHRKGYKNFEYVAIAFSKVLKVWPDISLILAGGGSLNADEKALLTKLKIARSTICEGDVGDARIQSLLLDGLALLSGSQNEGFGLTFLEAMQCGTIPIASNTSSIPEVIGSAGILVNPGNPDAMAQGMCDLLEKPGLRNALQEKGLVQAKQFSWEKTAAETMAVYKKCLEN